ncbi:MAG: hypothetical protein ABSF64_30695 [Bryobacteraceae bacterium]|jgi:hypothetical protein
MNARVLAPVLTGLLAAGAAFGGDAEFDRIVKAIESRYGTRPQHIPFLGVANLFVKVARPEGAAGFRLAVFEGLRDLQSDGDTGQWRERDRFMDTVADSNLRPLVRVHSRHDGEATYIFVGPVSKPGKSTRVLIATFERNAATVIEVKANIEKLLESLQEPEHARHTLAGGL